MDAVSSQLPRRRAEKAMAVNDGISPQKAADILQMSRPSVTRLIEKGLLHPRKVLSRNKLLRVDVEAFQAAQSRQQRLALSSLVALTEDYDF